MKFSRSHFWYTNSQRNGIFFLALLVAGLQLATHFIDYSNDEPINFNSPELMAFQKEIDSLKEIELERRKPKVLPFNPSFLTDFKGYQLGMTPQQIDKLLAHRANGLYINSAREFQAVTGVSDSLLEVISPLFKFPEWLNQTNRKKKRFRTVSEEFKEYDLNSATARDFTSINGIGEVLASRIVKFRNRLGGFLIEAQLYEVYGLDQEIADLALKKFKILKVPSITKVDINTASFNDLLKVVYIDYDLCIKILQYRDEIAEFQTLEELKNIEDFPLEKFDRIALYLLAR